MTGRPTRIVLVDDHVLVRSGMKALLDAQPDLEVTGEAGDGAEGVELALASHPDVVLMDLAMPVLDGIEATKRIVAAGSRARILVVTSHDDAAEVRRLTPDALPVRRITDHDGSATRVKLLGAP